MRIERLLVAALCATLPLLSGCPDSGDDDDTQPREGDASATLISGLYQASNADIHSDGCELGYSASDLNTSQVSVTVTGSNIDLGGVPATYSNGNLTGGMTQNGADIFLDGSCLVDITQTEDGTVPEDNVMDIVESLHVENPVGAGCSEIPASLPCTTTYFARLSL